MLLKQCRTVDDLQKRGLDYMSKNGFAPYKVEIQGQWMMYSGMRVHIDTEEEKNAKLKYEELQAEADKKAGRTLISKEKVNENVELDRTNFKIDITKYIKNYVPRGYVPDKLPENLLQTEKERIEALEKKLPVLTKEGKMRGQTDEEQIKPENIAQPVMVKKRGRPRKTKAA